MSENINNQQNEDAINFEKIFKMVWRNIWLFIICGIVAIGAAYVYNKYALRMYEVSASVLIKENETSPLMKGMNDMFTGGFLGGNENLQNELLIIKSMPVIQRMVENLNLEVGYFKYEDYNYRDAYTTAPFKVIFFREHPQIVGSLFDIVFLDNGSYILTLKKQDVNLYRYDIGQKVSELKDKEIELNGKPGEVLETGDLKIIVEVVDENQLKYSSEKRYGFKLQTNTGMAKYYKSALKFSIADKLATVININLEGTSVKRGTDVINELIKVYSQFDLDEKNYIANMTIAYIEQQLKEVSESLNLTEDSLQQFLSENQLVDVQRQAEGYSVQLIDLKNKLAELMTQKRYFSYVSDYLSGNREEAQIIAPSSMGVQDPLLNKLIMDLSEAQSKRSNLIQNKQERNPLVERLGIQIENLKLVVTENIESAANSNNINISELNKRIRSLEHEISKLPKTQLQLGGIERNYKLNDAIYNFLLQKHAEAKITKASNLPDNSMVEPAAMVGNLPVSPNSKMIYLVALFLGAGLPFGFLLLLMMFKNTVETREDLEQITNAPVLGTILHADDSTIHNVFRKEPNSNISESYRALRTNIGFYVKHKNHTQILVSSSLSGEGKSFNALNIAAAYAFMGKKTVLLNFDLRKPTRMIKGNNKGDGLSTYLAGLCKLEDIIHKSSMDNLYLITAGPIPPNPMELIASDETEHLFEALKQDFDTIVIDSPPMGQVTDAFYLSKYADLCLMVTRYKTTKKKMIRLILKELKQKNINNVALLLNDNKLSDEQFGYGYGYYKK